MSDATVSAATIRPGEAAHFGKLAAEWWDPQGSSAMLHRLGPVRLAFLRDAIDRHWGADPESLKPLAGKRALDVGCGAGLLAEPLARLGAEVTGVDAAAETVAAARGHAAGAGLAIDYRQGELAGMELGTFDLHCVTHPVGEERCAESQSCSIRPVWMMLQQKIDDVLESVHLGDLLVDERAVRRRVGLPVLTV